MRSLGVSTLLTEVSPIRKCVWNVPKFWSLKEFGTFRNNVKRPKLWIYVSNVPNLGTFETSFLIGETSGFLFKSLKFWDSLEFVELGITFPDSIITMWVGQVTRVTKLVQQDLPHRKPYLITFAYLPAITTFMASRAIWQRALGTRFITQTFNSDGSDHDSDSW